MSEEKIMENENPGIRWSKLAIIGFIIAIIGLILLLGLTTFGILPLLGIILCVIGLRKINRSANQIKGKGLAVAGIILGGLGLILPLLISTSVIWTKIARL